jgi:transcription initiation factor IIE alpha subunit
LDEPKSTYYTIHFNLNKLLKSNSEEDFLLLFEAMGTFKGKIIEEELSEILNILLNFTIQKIGRG